MSTLTRHDRSAPVPVPGPWSRPNGPAEPPAPVGDDGEHAGSRPFGPPPRRRPAGGVAGGRARPVLSEIEHPWLVAAAAFTVCLVTGALGGLAGGVALARVADFLLSHLTG